MPTGSKQIPLPYFRATIAVNALPWRRRKPIAAPPITSKNTPAGSGVIAMYPGSFNPVLAGPDLERAQLSGTTRQVTKPN